MALSRKFRKANRTHTIPLVELRQEDAVKDFLPDAPEGDGLTLGLAGAIGSPVVGTTTNNTSATEFASYDFVIPSDYRNTKDLTVRLSCFIDTNARNATSNLQIQAQLIKGGNLDATDLVTSGVIDIKAVTTATDQDFTVAGNSAGDLISAGDVLRIMIIMDNDDTGGSNAGFFQLNKLSVIVPSWE